MLQNCSAQKNCRHIFPVSRILLAPVAAASSCWVPGPVTSFLPPSGTHGGQEGQTLPMRLLTGMCAIEFSPPINDCLRIISARIQTTSQVWGCDTLPYTVGRAYTPDPPMLSLTLGLALINDMLADRYEQWAEVHLCEWACPLAHCLPLGRECTLSHPGSSEDEITRSKSAPHSHLGADSR